MSTPDGRLHITYNGEIYNYLEIKVELERQGEIFATSTDTEVVLRAWARWEIAALRRFEGMFAFVLFDSVARRVFAVRDFFGIKPLYWCRWRDGVAFASEMPTLLDLPGVSRHLNVERTFAYLRFNTTDEGEETLVKGVKQVEPGTALTLDLATSAHNGHRYWRPQSAEPLDIRFEAAAGRLRELFLDNVRRHLRSDVPWAIALSGGIDSSAIISAVRHLDRTIELQSLSYIDREPKLSEARWIDIVSSHVSARAWRVCPTPDDLLADLPILIRRQGEPFGTTSIYAQYRIFRLARERGIKVVLEGQGADEILAGYTVYQGARLASLLRQGHLGQAFAFLRRSARQPQRSAGLLSAFAGMLLLPGHAAAALRRLVGRSLVPSWLSASWFAEQGVPAALHSPHLGGHPLAVRDHLRRALVTSVSSNLPRLLRYGDRNAMAFSIENRVPFLTPDLVEFVLALPEAYIVGEDGTSKRVFREALRGIVPDVVLDRRDKIGFATSEADWLSHAPGWLAERLALAGELGPFSQAGLARLDVRREPDFVWRVCNFVEWCQAFAIKVPPARRLRCVELPAVGG
jgi:asparagine synthase (glutamine-hydrolysing)